MDPWILLSLSIALFLTLKLLLPKLKPKKSTLPPGPSTILFLAKLLWQKRNIFQMEQPLRQLHAKYGPVISIHTSVFITGRDLSHQVLVTKGAALSDRPSLPEPNYFINGNISFSNYGPRWRLLRRNLTSEILHPSRVKLFAQAREWTLNVLTNKLNNTEIAEVAEIFQFAMSSLLVFMCFGVKLGEKDVKEINHLQLYLLGLFTKFNIFAFFPKITKVVFRKRWNEIAGVRRRQEEIFLPLIRARQQQKIKASESNGFYTYADSLLDLTIEEEGGRKLSEHEIVTLCHEFLSGGTDTTATTLEWIMAELVKHPEIQCKIVEEINGVVMGEQVDIEEEGLQKMSYLKAVVMEGLRRHPPGHFVLPHRAAEDVVLNGYLIPKGANIHLSVADVNWDEKVWEEPMEFKPERFLNEGVDITGSREIRMMPFGAGRRICPGYQLALLHLEYFVGNLVRKFEWKAVEGEEIDLSEKLEFTTVMKNPLRARILPRDKQ